MSWLLGLCKWLQTCQSTLSPTLTRAHTRRLLASCFVASREEKCTPLFYLREHRHRKEHRLGNELCANDSDDSYYCHCQFGRYFRGLPVARLLTRELDLSVVCFWKMAVVMSLHRQYGRLGRLLRPIFPPLVRSWHRILLGKGRFTAACVAEV